MAATGRTFEVSTDGAADATGTGARAVPVRGGGRVVRVGGSPAVTSVIDISEPEETSQAAVAPTAAVPARRAAGEATSVPQPDGFSPAALDPANSLHMSFDGFGERSLADLTAQLAAEASSHRRRVLGTAAAAVGGRTSSRVSQGSPSGGSSGGVGPSGRAGGSNSTKVELFRDNPLQSYEAFAAMFPDLQLESSSTARPVAVGLPAEQKPRPAPPPPQPLVVDGEVTLGSGSRPREAAAEVKSDGPEISVGIPSLDDAMFSSLAAMYAAAKEIQDDEQELLGSFHASAEPQPVASTPPRGAAVAGVEEEEDMELPPGVTTGRMHVARASTPKAPCEVNNFVDDVEEDDAEDEAVAAEDTKDDEPQVTVEVDASQAAAAAGLSGQPGASSALRTKFKLPTEAELQAMDRTLPDVEAPADDPDAVVMLGTFDEDSDEE